MCGNPIKGTAGMMMMTPKRHWQCNAAGRRNVIIRFALCGDLSLCSRIWQKGETERPFKLIIDGEGASSSPPFVLFFQK